MVVQVALRSHELVQDVIDNWRLSHEHKVVGSAHLHDCRGAINKGPQFVCHIKWHYRTLTARDEQCRGGDVAHQCDVIIKAHVVPELTNRVNARILCHVNNDLLQKGGLVGTWVFQRRNQQSAHDRGNVLSVDQMLELCNHCVVEAPGPIWVTSSAEPRRRINDNKLQHAVRVPRSESKYRVSTRRKSHNDCLTYVQVVQHGKTNVNIEISDVHSRWYLRCAAAPSQIHHNILSFVLEVLELWVPRC
mmetsp:Transcript_1496/g.2237  ORF Transcript_1496/g.2237 Transcript_1496/m.2237 type:complete len:247 (-) Transcript_1496:437-1177(-)